MQKGKAYGSISFDSAPIDVVIQVEPQQFIIQVADQGEGISVVEQEQIVEAFYRAKNISSFRGSGLGFTINKNFRVDTFTIDR